jgi:hypothetical protein
MMPCATSAFCPAIVLSKKVSFKRDSITNDAMCDSGILPSYSSVKKGELLKGQYH